MGSSAALIISAIIAAAGAGATAAAQSSATNKANRTNLALANISRQDQLAANAESVGLQRRQIAGQERQAAFQREEALYQRGERAQDRATNSVNTQYGKAIGLLNTNQQLLSNLDNIFARRAA